MESFAFQLLIKILMIENSNNGSKAITTLRIIVKNRKNIIKKFLKHFKLSYRGGEKSRIVKNAFSFTQKTIWLINRFFNGSTIKYRYYMDNKIFG